MSMSLVSLAADGKQMPTEAEMEMRVASPAHFLIKIHSFSFLEEHEIDKLKTREFESGEYKWRLVIYPNGHGVGEDGEGYVSVYLAMANTKALPLNWEVYATFSICMFNHISGNYSYSLGRAWRFHAFKKKWGFMKFISKKDFNDPSKGYLVGDKCVFGAEVLVNENTAVIESLHMKSVDKEPYKLEFKISNVSKLKKKWVSEEFTFRGHEWMIVVYPNGCGVKTGHSVSVYLHHVVSNNLDSFERMMLCFTVKLKDLSIYLEHHRKTLYDHWFKVSEMDDMGWDSFIKLSSLHDPNKHFIVNDCCVLEIEFDVQVLSY